jgi:ABC-type branched-subunit amino acid transport system ATPase component
VPQGRRTFPSLTVEENLRVLRTGRHDRWNVAGVHELFPRLAERRRSRAGTLAGSEQQMLAIGRALLRNSRPLIVGEPAEGLAPRVVDELAGVAASWWPRASGCSLSRKTWAAGCPTNLYPFPAPSSAGSAFRGSATS